jgi:hypothetical protein
VAVAELKNARDRALLEALLEGLNVKQAAERSGTSLKTAYRRMADPRFREQLASSRQAVIAGIVGKLSANAETVLGVLLTLIEDPDVPATARVRACHDWLDALETYGAGEDLAARLATLEEAVTRVLEERRAA